MHGLETHRRHLVHAGQWPAIGRQLLQGRLEGDRVVAHRHDLLDRPTVDDRGDAALGRADPLHAAPRELPLRTVSAGLLGQVTRVHPLQSEVSLLTHDRAAVPVLNERTGARAAAYGGAREHGMELRFVASNADVRVGDVLVTSGLDGIYPPGLKVARVASVDRLAGAGFAGIGLAPLARADGVRHVLVLEPMAAQLPRPAASEGAAPARPASGAASRPGARDGRQVTR